MIFGTHCHSLGVVVNSNKIIRNIFMNFPVILKESFYDKMVKTYGYPNHILKLDKLLHESKSEDIDEGFHQNLTKRSYSMKEVNFEEKPFSIIWKKLLYQLEMRFSYEDCITQISYITIILYNRITVKVYI